MIFFAKHQVKPEQNVCIQQMWATITVNLWGGWMVALWPSQASINRTPRWSGREECNLRGEQERRMPLRQTV